MLDDNIRALVRGLDVLKHLNRVGSDSGQHIAACLNLPRPTAYRILGTLEACGLVARAEDENTFRVTREVKALSGGLTTEAWVLWIATPILYDLQRDLLWPTDLATFENGEMVIRETTHAVSPYSIETGMVGSRHSMLRSSFGRAYLAYCPQSERRAILRRLAGQPTPEGALARTPEYPDRLIHETQMQGFAARHREVHVKTSSIAVPIRFRDRVVACMNVVWIASAIEFSKASQQYYPRLAAAQERIERELVNQRPGRGERLCALNDGPSKGCRAAA
ncbi:MAG: helix-turn-helix domain-containing protein [Caulobacteraceae bacterium]|nr:helix-turn-helix domain-containing protein [Caulobacteraceae bacterium]